jgi:SAM-dependent methyltransferase
VNRDIRDVEDVLDLLDRLFAKDADRWTIEGSDWWDSFYADRDRSVPFFVAKPDENLVSYLDRGLVRVGRALDLGCGPGRNTVRLLAAEFAVDAIDLSLTAIDWAVERLDQVGVLGDNVQLMCGNAFNWDLGGPYDLIYDSGFFHHLPPHRRVSYLRLLDQNLAKGGYFGLTCFASGAMGSETPDAELYRAGSLEGGLAYTEEELRWIFADYTEVELRRMNDEPADSPHFGESFLWTALFQRPA